MKRLAVLLFILFLIQVASAQNNNAGYALLNNRCKHHYISLTPKRNKNKLRDVFPFRSIEVVDYRPDSSRIGLFVVKRQQADFLFKSSPGTVIKSFLNEAYTNPLASKTLLVVIRELWFSDILFEKQLDKVPSPFRSRISFRAETYVKENTGYIPLTYFDTTITSPKNIIDIAPFRITELMTSLVEKINSSDISPAYLQTKRLLSFAAVDSFSNKSFSYPIDAPDTLREGVYASFEDFRNNKPSIFNYEIEKENNSLMTLRLKDEQGKSYYSRKMWGYCDGQRTYVMMDGNLFPIFTYDRAYYVYGSKEYLVKRNNLPLLLLFPGALVFATVPISENVTRHLRFFRLDIKTGEIL